MRQPSVSLEFRPFGASAGPGALTCCFFSGMKPRLVLLSPSPQVEFPEARIYEETLNVLLYETPRVPDNSLLEATSRSRSQASPSEDEETLDLRDRVRRIHVKRYSTYDDRQLGHQSAHRD